MLNAGARAAREANCLPVRLDVSPILFDSAIGFFRALLDAAVVALASEGEVRDSSDRYVALSSGEDASSSELAGTSFYLAHTTDLSPALVEADLMRVTLAAKQCGLNGVVYLVDNGNYLFDDAEHAVLEILNGLLALPHPWVFVVGGNDDTPALVREHSYSMCQRFRAVGLPGLFNVADVRDIVAAPSEKDTQSGVDDGTAFDLMLIARGEPYWVKFAAHYMWEHSDSDLTPELIRTIAEGRRDSARDPEKLEESLGLMDSIDVMEDDLVAEASGLAPFEAMTLSEYVLAQRAKDLADGKDVSENSDDDIADAERAIGELVDRGLLKVTDDRFEVAGGFLAKAYLRYEAARRSGSKPIAALGHSSYGTAAAPAWLERLAGDIGGPSGERIATYLSAGESSDDVVGPLVSLHEAVESGDPVGIATAGFIPSSYGLQTAEAKTRRSAALAYVGIVFEVGVDNEISFVLQRVACGWIRWADSEPDDVGCVDEIDEWLSRHRDELAGYRLRVERVVAGTVPVGLADQAVALMAPGAVADVTLDLYKDNRLSDALEYLQAVVPGLEKGLTADGPWRYERPLSDAYVRLGFIAAALGRDIDAWAALSRCDELVAGRPDGVGGVSDQILRHYNMAYVRGLRGEFAAAADLARKAASLNEAAPVPMYLLLYLPTIAGWSEPDRLWNVVSLESSDVAGVLEAQVLCYDALAGRFSAAEFNGALAEVSPTACAGFRLLGWVWLSRFGDAGRAVAAFEAAEAMSASEIGAAELAFARARC
jgi:hypothetical protein